MLLSSMQMENGVIYSDGQFNVLALSNSKIDDKALTFIDNEKFLNEINSNLNISCIICTEQFIGKFANHIQGIFISNNPRIEFFKLHNNLCNSSSYLLRNFATRISEDCCISPLAYIDKNNIVIGKNVVIEEFVSIRGHVTIGDNTIIRSGVSIGGQGFEYKRDGCRILPVIHTGSVEIGDDVHILNNTTIHRAVYPWDKTLIGSSTKISSHVHIDHGSKIGKSVFIGAGAIISGRSVINNSVYIGPQTVISNRLNIGNDAKVTLGSVVTKDVEANTTVTGNFAISHDTFIQNLKKSCV